MHWTMWSLAVETSNQQLHLPWEHSRPAHAMSWLRTACSAYSAHTCDRDWVMVSCLPSCGLSADRSPMRAADRRAAGSGQRAAAAGSGQRQRAAGTQCRSRERSISPPAHIVLLDSCGIVIGASGEQQRVGCQRACWLLLLWLGRSWALWALDRTLDVPGPMPYDA
jgi:hypothetical protein